MIQVEQTNIENYLSAFKIFEQAESSTSSNWMINLRRNAIAQFENSGFPTARRGNEEWKYTDVSPIAKGSFKILHNKSHNANQLPDTKYQQLEGSACHNLVFVDGFLDENLTNISSLPKEVLVCNLSDAVSIEPTFTQRHLAKYADFLHHPFTALNTAFMAQGAFIWVPPNISIDKPLQVLFISSSSNSNLITNPRILALTGENSKFTLIENHSAVNENSYLANVVSEIVLGTNSNVQYYRIQQESKKAFHISTTHVELGKGSRFFSMNLDLGGEIVRNNLNVVTEGEDSSCSVNGIYITTASQHIDNKVVINHNSSYTTSRELYKGILSGKSKAIFHGSIVVREGLRQIDALQIDKNLLLSDQAQANTKPAFWIYSDDVKCGHGAASGQIDRNAIFYLTSRGISESDARNLLVKGFVQEVIESIPNKFYKDKMDNMVNASLLDVLGI
ncbi:Fe-S cluster assembly protein SufD [SAR202 cluster bacterium AC-409-J13_OGT_754m]|nr:Fe-S cluster assembly protein SufD [SAR202 cluster bacterium AC-409-J13_OGT_754m]